MNHKKKIGMTGKIITALLALLGFSLAGCREEYGCPYVNFHVSGRVVDAQANPIPGIEITADEYGSTRSDSQGYFTIEENYASLPGKICCTDRDGEENGGEFLPEEVDLEGRFVQTAKGSGWYEGAYKAELGEVTLTKAEAGDSSTDDSSADDSSADDKRQRE